MYTSMACTLVVYLLAVYILYADDIVLLSCSCCGMQRLIDICVEYGVTWDISFNANKTQCVTFDGRNPQISLRLGSVVLQ